MPLGLYRAKHPPVVSALPLGDRLQPQQVINAAESLELLPVPIALVGTKNGCPVIDAANRPFRQAGLGAPGGESLLLTAAGRHIATFLGGTATHEDFDLTLGSAVDSRHFRVTLARRSEASDRCFVTLVDHTSERRTERNLRREMITDSLTGLPNRSGFGELIEERMANADHVGRYAVLMIDLDRFSRVNSCLGSLTGDELLITAARRLKGALRAVDILARTGGDEFGVLLTLEESPDEAEQVALRIQGALSAPFRLSDFEIRVAASVGIAFATSATDEAEDLMRHAQFAIKRSKASGQAEFYQPQAFDAARAQFGIETDLRRAIENRALRLTFQPILDLASGRVVSFEALARWRAEDGTEQSPSDFIPVAEESGLIVPLGRWAMDEAARILAGWDAQAGGDCGARMAVNLSAIQLQRDSIPGMVEQALANAGLPGSRFVLELTESALVSDPGRVAETMHALKALGTNIAMDDFGTGYSNLASLQKLPIDILKIDRSFVTGMLSDRDKIAIVRAILSLAQALGMRTTAEGIETNELGQTLAALGCTYGQGYVYARPLEMDAAYAFLRATNA